MMALRTSIVEHVLAMPQTVGLTRATFLAYILPPFVCQYVMGVLVQLEGTRFYRLAFLPVTLCLAWRATWVDLSGGDASKRQLNTMLVTQMCSMATRSAAWAFSRVRYRRLYPATKSRDRESSTLEIYTACWNTWDLLVNPRGIGWNWPRGLVVPKHPVSSVSQLDFVLSTALGVALHALAFDACVQTVRVLSPETFGSLNGGTLFDHTLPPLLERARAVLVCYLAAASAYHGVQYTYGGLAILFTLLFRQTPSQWPPLFDAPWSSTSLSELWGRRWHQMMRDVVLALGGVPLGGLFGRLGGVLGAFLVSGVFHDVEFGHGGYSVVVVGFWVMNGVGVVLERVWTRATGRSVGGVWGRTWMVGWLVAWGIPMADAYAKTGRFGALSVVGGFEPSLVLVRLVGRLFGVAR